LFARPSAPQAAGHGSTPHSKTLKVLHCEIVENQLF
jgi:hypothetical protein